MAVGPPVPVGTITSRAEDGPVSVDAEKQVWNCKNPTCGRGGSAIDAWMAAYGVDASEAIAELAKMAGISPNGSEPKRHIVDTYDYTGEDGTLLFQVVRYEPKELPANAGRTATATGFGTCRARRRVLFGLPEVLRAKEAGETVWVAEGEEEALALRAAGVCATTNPGGAGKWKRDYTEQLRGAGKVRVVSDADDSGHAHVAKVAPELAAAVGSLEVLEPPEGFKDVAQLLGAGRGLEELVEVEASSSTNGRRRGCSQRWGQRSARRHHADRLAHLLGRGSRTPPTGSSSPSSRPGARWRPSPWPKSARACWLSMCRRRGQPATRCSARSQSSPSTWCTSTTR